MGQQKMITYQWFTISIHLEPEVVQTYNFEGMNTLLVRPEIKSKNKSKMLSHPCPYEFLQNFNFVTPSHRDLKF